jgi:hypothetical protein
MDKLKTKQDALKFKLKELNEVQSKLGVQKSAKQTERTIANLRRKLDDMKSKTQKRRQQMNNLVDRQNEIQGTSTKDLKGGDLAQDDHPTMKQIRTIGNRLDKVMIKYNEALDMKKTYGLLKTKLEQERLTYERSLQQVEHSLKGKDFDLAKMVTLSKMA